MIEVVPATDRAALAAARSVLDDPIRDAHFLQLIDAAETTGRSRLPLLLAREGARPVGAATAAPMVLLHARSFEAARALADAIAHRIDGLRVLIAEPGLARIAHARMAEMRELAIPRAVPHLLYRRDRATGAAASGDALSVRGAVDEDASTLAEVVGGLISSELGYDPRPRATYPSAIRAQIRRGIFFVAHARGDARALAYCSTSVSNARTLRLDNFVVPESLRGRGYGKAAAVAFARVLGDASATASVLVRTENAVARATYAAAGFAPCGELLYLYGA